MKQVDTKADGTFCMIPQIWIYVTSDSVSMVKYWSLQNPCRCFMVIVFISANSSMLWHYCCMAVSQTDPPGHLISQRSNLSISGWQWQSKVIRIHHAAFVEKSQNNMVYAGIIIECDTEYFHYVTQWYLGWSYITYQNMCCRWWCMISRSLTLKRLGNFFF